MARRASAFLDPSFCGTQLPCDPAAEIVDDGPVRGESGKRRLLVLMHEAAVTLDVCRQDRGELALHFHPSPQAIILLAPPARQAAPHGQVLSEFAYFSVHLEPFAPR